MAFIELNNLSQLEDIKNDSKTSILFKHSTRCSISSMALSRMQRDLESLTSWANVYYLDLIRYRDISNSIEQTFEVEHASPQVIVVKEGKSIFDASHGGINPSELNSIAN